MEEVCVPIEQVTKRRGRKSSLVSGILVGSLIGAGIALLSAPYSGDEARNRLKNKSVEIKDKVAVKSTETRGKVEEIARRGSERVNELKARGQEVIQEQKVNLESTVKGIREGVRSYRTPEIQPIPMTGEPNPSIHEELAPEDVSLSTKVETTDLTGPDPH